MVESDHQTPTYTYMYIIYPTKNIHLYVLARYWLIHKIHLHPRDTYVCIPNILLYQYANQYIVPTNIFLSLSRFLSFIGNPFILNLLSIFLNFGQRQTTSHSKN